MSYFQDVIVDPLWDSQQGPQGIPGESIVGPKGDSIIGPPGMADQFQFVGKWSRVTKYARLDVCLLEGSSYVCTVDNRGNKPSSKSKFWQLLSIKGKDGRDGKDGTSQRGRRGADGKDGVTQGGGGGFDPITTTFNQATTIGQPIYIDSSGNASLALANDSITTEAVGFSLSNTLANATGQYITEGQINKDNWSLAPGATYYLSDAVSGDMTTVPPTGAGHYVVALGRALSPTCLDVEIQPSIKLSGNVAVGPGALPVLSAVVGEDINASQIVYIDAGGLLNLALADDSITAQAIGFAYSSNTTGETIDYFTEGQITLANLTPGALYFLSADTPGGLTTVSPTTVGQYVVQVGRAVSEDLLDIEIQASIKL